MIPLLELALEHAPGIIAAFRESFMHRNPDAPVPTDAEINAAFHQAFAKSLGIDDAFLAATDPAKKT